MSYIKIKIVGVEGNSVLVKYATENSKKSIDEYEAVAYQPSALGYSDVESFLEGIKPALTLAAEERDRLESDVVLDISSWANNEVVFERPQADPAEPSQVLPHLLNPEVKI